MRKKSLTHEEILKLLQRGRTALRQKNPYECNRALVQLENHVLGDPYVTDGPVPRKECKVAEIYMQYVESADEEESSLIQTAWRLMKLLRK